MIRKLILCSLFLVCLSGMCCGCTNSKKIVSVSELAAHNQDSEYDIYIPENEQYVPYIVITDDYDGSVLLLRKDVLDLPGRINEYSSLYRDSEMDRYLNTEYLSMLSDIQDRILITEIQVTAEEALGISGDRTEIISRKAFLLSCTEVNIQSENMAAEGKALEFFKDSDNRAAYNNGTAANWWLRTPDTGYLSCTYVIGSNNKIGSTNAFDENGIRPAFCVSPSLQVEMRDDIVENQLVYTLGAGY